MKKTKIIKMLVTVIAVVLVFAFATTAFAYWEVTTISASSKTSAVKKANITRSYSKWSAGADSYFVRFNDTVRLTVRPYKAGTSIQASDSKTYSPTVESGGRTYTLNPLPSKVGVKASATEDNALCGVTGPWKF